MMSLLLQGSWGRCCSCTVSRRFGTRGAIICWPWPPPATAPSRWRGYGLSDQPPEPEAASYDDLVEDLLAILDALSIPKVALPIFGSHCLDCIVWSWLGKNFLGRYWFSEVGSGYG